jgi:DNA polymerase III delta prime subunit
MYAETYRPTGLDDIIGHTEAKESLKRYLNTPGFPKAIMLTGSPGIGKTTLALASAKTLGFEPLEINASRSIRSFEDVEKIKDACRSSVSIHAFIRGDRTRKTCVILDEIDGSDPHAQGKIIAWIKDPDRKVPIICTGNELPTVFKNNSDYIDIIRCFPPRSHDIQDMFKEYSISEEMIKDCQYDIRKIIHRIQYGISDLIPKFVAPPTGIPMEKTFIMRQAMFGLDDHLREYRVCKEDSEQTLKTSSRYKVGETRVHTDESGKLRKKSRPGKLHSSKSCSGNPLEKP